MEGRVAEVLSFDGAGRPICQLTSHPREQGPEHIRGREVDVSFDDFVAVGFSHHDAVGRGCCFWHRGVRIHGVGSMFMNVVFELAYQAYIGRMSQENRKSIVRSNESLKYDSVYRNRNDEESRKQHVLHIPAYVHTVQIYQLPHMI